MLENVLLTIVWMRYFSDLYFFALLHIIWNLRIKKFLGFNLCPEHPRLTLWQSASAKLYLKSGTNTALIVSRNKNRCQKNTKTFNPAVVFSRYSSKFHFTTKVTKSHKSSWNPYIYISNVHFKPDILNNYWLRKKSGTQTLVTFWTPNT